MRRLVGGLIVGLLAAGLATAPGVGGEAEEFATACRKAGGDATLCTCKSEAAAELLEARLRGLVMLSMTNPAAFTAKAQNGELSDADSRAWNRYIQQSNRVCKPGY